MPHVVFPDSFFARDARLNLRRSKHQDPELSGLKRLCQLCVRF